MFEGALGNRHRRYHISTHSPNAASPIVSPIFDPVDRFNAGESLADKDTPMGSCSESPHASSSALSTTYSKWNLENKNQERENNFIKSVVPLVVC